VTWRAFLALVAAIGLTATAAAQEGASPTPTATEADYATVVDKAIDAYILPAYADLENATHDLIAQVEGYCLAPSAETQQALADGFARTVKAWAGVDFFRFGPMARDGRYERFAFWPDVHGTGARQLRRFLAEEDSALLEPGVLAEQSAAVQGLPALERLLYSGSKGLTNAGAPDQYRCALAMAVARNMDEIASEALNGWTGDESWASLMRAPGEQNPVYRTESEAMTEVLKAILTGIEQVRDQRLHAALGDSPDEARASRAPYNRSGQALAYLRASAQALNDFVEASGILKLTPKEQSWIANSATFELGNLQRALAALPGDDLAPALADDDERQGLSYAMIVLASLRDLFQRQLGPAAGLTQGFNSLDGD
jgi:predicted lipoprotein